MSVGVVLTIRLIRSFEYRNVKLMVLKRVDLDINAAELKTLILERLRKEPAFTTLRNIQFDTLKIHQLSAHQYKDQNLVVNLSRDEWLLQDDDKLSDKGISAEAEISFFNRDAYNKFKANPEVKW
eukprot:Plantae.Rhodophyta-Purpureofilum_apyrenoidigerum.ctg22322.p1 GENE.Plantae.Rhodophyta-Purpureofilum_apyrenoidigerum.ctg22322~~Plantae.Rhodophyta-Purpureofilum_apyrenoidigerum.ctg22322.p1  ORF type:complete len:145 (+),score=32.05 Plantae.Rhodophyta-Purpureofilum_apyrenoidigerum.ctg22322:61-435(+)